MITRSTWIKKTMLASTALVALLTCTGCDDAATATGDGFGDETIQGEDNGFPTNTPPEVAGMGTGTGGVDDSATPATASGKIAELEGIYPVDIDGDWTVEALEVLDEVLAVYRPDPTVLANLQKIQMVDQNDASVGNNRLLAVFNGRDCQTSGVTPAQCWGRPVAANDPMKGVITVLGNSQDSTLGSQMVAVDTIQHEIGHFFSESRAKDAAWRTSWRNEAMLQPFEISQYSQSSQEEFYAELWSKLFTQRDKALSEVQWSSQLAQPLPQMVSSHVSAGLPPIVRQAVQTPIRSQLVR